MTAISAAATRPAGDRLRLAVILGGRSPEHAVSVVSGRSILATADPDRFEVEPFGITRGGHWLTPAETRERLARVEAGMQNDLGPEPDGREPRGILAAPEALAALRGVDVVFPIVHGPHGEDGTLQGLLELAGVPYVGSGVAASAAGMDKALMRAVFAQAGLPQARYHVLRGEEARAPRAEALRAVADDLGFPLFVKPANGGSSIGVVRAQAAEELAPAIAEAARYDHIVLCEEALPGREIECAVLGNSEPHPSPLGEIRPAEGFYTYEAKYGDRGTELIVPAAVSPAAEEQVRGYAVRAFRALDCAGLARVDCFVDGDRVWVNEVNTLPGFTPISMYPRLWEEAGVGYRQLITRLVEFALERHRREVARG